VTSNARRNIQLSTVLLLVINMYRQPPPSPPVPRQQRAGYVDSNMDVVEQCHICLDPLDAAHPSARFRGPDKCQHIFGAPPCLREWCLTRNVNAARCPICRMSCSLSKTMTTAMSILIPAAKTRRACMKKTGIPATKVKLGRFSWQ
jgi:hypothetical protein